MHTLTLSSPQMKHFPWPNHSSDVQLNLHFQPLAGTSSLLGADVHITQYYFTAGSPGQTTSIQIHLYSMQILDDSSLGSTALHCIIVSKYRINIFSSASSFQGWVSHHCKNSILYRPWEHLPSGRLATALPPHCHAEPRCPFPYCSQPQQSPSLSLCRDDTCTFTNQCMLLLMKIFKARTYIYR